MTQGIEDRLKDLVRIFAVDVAGFAVLDNHLHVVLLLTRLGTSADVWNFRLEKLQGVDRLFGTVFSTRRSEINRFAVTRGVKKISNLNGCPG